MCGIAGVFNINGSTTIPRERIEKMIASIRHRGPDECGIYLDDDVALGHARLSVVGIEDGIQPICNEDRTLWIIYNGEIYDYHLIRAQLKKEGHLFKTNTDTEVLLHLYERYGEKCLEMINGQYAVAIWDMKKRALFLARDRVGIRPLYYCRTADKFLFASEIKALFSHPDVNRAIDPRSILQTFTFWSCLPTRTIFKNVFSLPPGHFMYVRREETVKKQYWQIPGYFADQRWAGSFMDAEEHLNALIHDAVKIRMVADVPVGAYLSGGLDSSIITALAVKHFNADLRTFSINFKESAYDESKFQRLLTDSIKTRNSRISISNADIAEYLPDVVWHCEQPILRTAPVPLFLLSNLVQRHHYKVVLTGEGADELFGGYNIFKEAKIRAFCGKRPTSRIRPRLYEKLYPYIFTNPSRTRMFLQKIYSVAPEDLLDPLFSHRIRWGNGKKTAGFFSEEMADHLKDYDPIDDLVDQLPSDFNSRDALSKAQYLEMAVFLSNYLLSSQGDRVALAHGLEIRLPFLDHRIIDFAFRLPANWKINGLNEKYILKRCAEGLVPQGICKREKQPYRAPVGQSFFRSVSSSYADHLLSGEYIKETGYFNAEKVGRFVRKMKLANNTVSNEMHNMAFLGILTTQLIHHRFIETFSQHQWEPVRIDNVIIGKRTLSNAA